MYSQQIVAWGQPLEGRIIPTPLPQGTEVLVRVSACGICHSDLHIWEGGFNLGGGKMIRMAERNVKLPLTLGHEIVGSVAALGPDAKGVEIGAQRVVFPWIGCGTCEVCQRGEELLCNNPRTPGTRRDGGYSDHVIVPHPRYLIDYTGVPAELACTYACSGITAYSALKKAVAVVGVNDHLLIIGTGGVGLAGVHLASSMIKGKVIVADVDPAKRALARQSGAWETIDNGAPDALQKIRALSGGGVAATVDFVGAPKTAEFSIDALRRGGVHISVGLFGDAYSLPLALLPLKMLTLMGSYVGTLDEMHELMALVKAGKVAPIPIETRPLDAANQSLNDLRDGKVKGRIVLKP